ncbi:hypothetical protein [Shewanella sp. MEBiC00475]|uniref:hypothetical protein n=1 Tax=Shewanella sp. MEBiC00475 TaxID=2575361 RepID=UPI0010C1189A|nr:hypothetical protein [Shewanella sp. MEBiC00475]
MKKSYFEIDPNVRLSSVPLFRVTLTVLPSLALLCFVIIVSNSNLELDPSYTGFNYGLFTVSKVPLTILATCITILGVIAAIHRSAQTTLQIEKATEQNTFSNFYKHRQEYVEHFSEIKEGLPDHISKNLSDKIIRGYYSSSYPFNNPSRFSIKANLGWIESFDKGLIEMTYILSKMASTNEINLVILLYKEFLRQETSIRQGLFDLRQPEEAEIVFDEYREVDIQYWDDSRSDISISKSVLKSNFKRIQDYADLLTKLKYLCDEFEGTMLYGTNVYSGLSTMEYHNKFNENLTDELFMENSGALIITEIDDKKVSKIFEEIKMSYDRKIAELDSIREANDCD